MIFLIKLIDRLLANFIIFLFGTGTILVTPIILFFWFMWDFKIHLNEMKEEIWFKNFWGEYFKCFKFQYKLSDFIKSNL